MFKVLRGTLHSAHTMNAIHFIPFIPFATFCLYIFFFSSTALLSAYRLTHYRSTFRLFHYFIRILLVHAKINNFIFSQFDQQHANKKRICFVVNSLQCDCDCDCVSRNDVSKMKSNAYNRRQMRTSLTK